MKNVKMCPKFEALMGFKRQVCFGGEEGGRGGGVSP